LGCAGGAAEEDINSQLGVGSVAADAELDAMKEQVGWLQPELGGVGVVELPAACCFPMLGA